MHPSTQPSRRQYGFTIVEVLVVISIISLLVSLLLPALKEAREMADATRCQACLRQTGVGISSYTYNNKDTPPQEYPGFNWSSPNVYSNPWGNTWGHQPDGTPCLWYYQNTNWYVDQNGLGQIPGLLGAILVEGEIPGYDAIKAGGMADNNRPPIWCPAKNVAPYANNYLEANNAMSLNQWKTYIGVGYTGTNNASAGADTNYVTRCTTPKASDRPSEWALVWDYETTPYMATYYWNYTQSQIHAVLFTKHDLNINALYIDGHVMPKDSQSRYLMDLYVSQGIPGINNSRGNLGIGPGL